MVRLVVRHDVIDYETWLALFEESASHLEARGVRQYAHYRDDANPDNVTVMLDFDDHETLESFVTDPENKRVLESHGVKPGGLLMSVTDV